MGSEYSWPRSISLAKAHPRVEGALMLFWRKAGKLPAGEGYRHPGFSPGAELNWERCQGTGPGQT